MPERRQQRRSGVIIANFKDMSYLFLVFLLLIQNNQLFGDIGLDFEQVMFAKIYQMNPSKTFFDL